MEESIQSLSANATTVEFNPYAPDFIESPYELYDRMRMECPLYRYHEMSGREWILTRYADIKHVLTDKKFIVENLPRRVPDPNRYIKASSEDLSLLRESLKPWLFSLDPPDHGRLRHLVSRNFTANAVLSLETFITDVVDERFNEFENTGYLDLIAGLARPLPVKVSAQMLGLPIDDFDCLRDCSETLFGVFEPPITFSRLNKMTEAAKYFQEVIRTEIKQRKQRRTQDDLLAQLIGSTGDGFSEDELVSFSAMLFAVGQETTENYIGNSVAALLQNEDQLDLLCNQPELLDNAVRELARFDSAVQFISRVPSEDVQMHGQMLRKGDRVYLALGAANHDPKEFENPGVLDLKREHITNLPFGSGIHFCLGNALAKLQLKIILKRLIELPQVEISALRPDRRKTVVIRGYRSLALTLPAAAYRVG